MPGLVIAAFLPPDRLHLETERDTDTRDCTEVHTTRYGSLTILTIWGTAQMLSAPSIRSSPQSLTECSTRLALCLPRISVVRSSRPRSVRCSE